MSDFLYRGMGPPYSVAATISATAQFAPTSVASTKLIVHKPSGAEVEWTTNVLSQTSALLKVEHPLATPDLDEVGVWKAWAVCAMSGGGERRTFVGIFHVLAPHEQRP